MEALLPILFFAVAVLLAIVALSWLLIICLMAERRAGRSDISYAASMGGALFLYTFSILLAKQALIEHKYHIGMPLLFALVPSVAIGLGTFALRFYFRQFREKS